MYTSGTNWVFVLFCCFFRPVLLFFSPKNFISDFSAPTLTWCKTKNLPYFEELKFRKALFDDKSLFKVMMMIVFVMVIVC